MDMLTIITITTMTMITITITTMTMIITTIMMGKRWGHQNDFVLGGYK
jgi:hypothetical protein